MAAITKETSGELGRSSSRVLKLRWIEETKTQNNINRKIEDIFICFYLIAQNNYFYLYRSYAMLQKI